MSRKEQQSLSVVALIYQNPVTYQLHNNNIIKAKKIYIKIFITRNKVKITYCKEVVPSYLTPSWNYGYHWAKGGNYGMVTLFRYIYRFLLLLRCDFSFCDLTQVKYNQWEEKSSSCAVGEWRPGSFCASTTSITKTRLYNFDPFLSPTFI